MTISIEQRWSEVATTDSATEAEQGASLRYLAFTDSGENEQLVRNYAKTNVPDSYDGLIFTKLDVERYSDTDDVWTCVAHYESAASPFTQPALSVDEVRWSIRSGVSVSLKRSYSRGLVSEVVTDSTYQFSGTAAEDVVGIKYGEKGFEATGIDYSVGAVELGLETVKDATEVSGGYLITAATYADQNAINSVAWRGFAAGTCRLVNYSATERSGPTPAWDVTYSIIFSPNLTSIKVGSMTVPSKEGHQLLDVLFTKQKVGKIMMGVPVRAAVHDWYPKINFNTVLGI